MFKLFLFFKNSFMFFYFLKSLHNSACTKSSTFDTFKTALTWWAFCFILINKGIIGHFIRWITWFCFIDLLYE